MTAIRSEPEFEILHSIRLKGFAINDAIVVATSLPLDLVAAEVERAQSCGYLRFREGRVTGWSLTAEGKERHQALLELDVAAGLLDVVIARYEDFLPLNDRLKAVCTEWQLNDHPPQCVQVLGALHHDVAAIVASLTAAFARFGSYGNRFLDALQRLHQGDEGAFTKPLSGSYHDVWMELHQDLLLTTGRERSATDGY